MGFSESGNRNLSTRLFPPTSLCEDVLQFVHFCWRSVSLIDVPISKKQKQITSQIYLFSVKCELGSFARLFLFDFILKMMCCERQRNIFEKAGWTEPPPPTNRKWVFFALIGASFPAKLQLEWIEVGVTQCFKQVNFSSKYMLMSYD